MGNWQQVLGGVLMSEASELKQIIVEYLKEYKAYNLPAVCKKYNIECNDELSPMNSKRVYIESGLVSFSFEKLQALAKKIIKEESDASFVKKCDLYLSDDFFAISMVTRRKIIDWLSNMSFIEGKLRVDEMLSLACNLESMDSFYGHKNALEDILQHMVRNDDLSYKEMFENVLNIMYVSDKKFIDFIQTIVHPRVRTNAEQKAYVDEVNAFLFNDGFILTNTKSISGEPVYTVEKLTKGVNGKVKNIIFASCGAKPDVIIEDSLSNDIKIVGDESKCLFYTLPISDKGLNWNDLVVWWNNGNDKYELKDEKELVDRLKLSLDSEPEKVFLRTYYNYIYKLNNKNLPALIPQVYCHYDPKSAKMRNGNTYVHQRMDFLMLISSNRRIIIEIDGKQHYSKNDVASPELYAKMVEDDRKLKLYGYDVFRFGGFEFIDKIKIKEKIEQFFYDLFKFYDLV